MIRMTLRYTAGGQVGANYTNTEEARATKDARRYFSLMGMIESVTVETEDGEELFYIDHDGERTRGKADANQV